MDEYIAYYNNNTHRLIEDLRQEWQAEKANVTMKIKTHVEDFFENVNSSTVNVTANANQNISVAITLVRQDVAGEVSANVKAYIASRLKILLVALSGAAEANVTVSV